MNQEKFGNFIKEIRKKNNLTQKQLADKYNVTYQAVSKWENGKNMPDTSLIKQMSKDFNVSLEELFEGEYKDKKEHKKRNVLILIIIILIVSFLLFLFLHKDDEFEFKTLSSSCNNFTISGNIAYNKNKSSIYITDIRYCGNENIESYNNIECILYEKDKNIEKKISSYKYEKKEPIKLEDYLKELTFAIDYYEMLCKEYSKNSLYLLIKASNDNEKVTTYKIPLSLNTCPK